MRVGRLPSIVLVLGLLIAWEVVVRWLGPPRILICAPTEVLRYMSAHWGRVGLNAGYTLLEASLGLLFANVFAFAFALSFVRFPIVEAGIMPVAIVLKTTPVIAIAPLLVAWLGPDGIWAKVVASALICFFPMLINATLGLKRADTSMVDFMRSLNASSWQEMRFLRIPSALPYVFSALRISAALSVVGAIVGEFVGPKNGLGYLIVDALNHYDSQEMYSAICLSGVLGVLLFSVATVAQRWFVKWQPTGD